MKRIIILLAAGLFLWPAFSATKLQASENQAIEAATAWLALVDRGDYEKSWQETSTLFKKTVTIGQWTAAVKNARETLGDVVSRKLSSSEEHTSLPGVPDGSYIILFFDSSFEKKEKGLETVTTMLDTDGRWRVSGYFVH